VNTTHTAYVSFERVWKQYRRGETHDSLRDLIPALSRRLLRRTNGTSHSGNGTSGEFWALRDVSFEARPGDALGIIGPNGAGKSTILKLLTRIVQPTRGHCEVIGRIGALIEIGAGFHPDLTGRENVFLQGSIMGMRRPEIEKVFDEIIAFAGLEEWVNTPVKRYSSGMYARLGYAVAAHLDPDVLIIDEVLAVGDAAFQRKAYDHIEAMRRRGVPIVVVSHDLDRVARVCTRALLLDHGQVVHMGTPREAIDIYLNSAASLEHASPEEPPLAIHSLEIHGSGEVPSGRDVKVTLRGSVLAPADEPRYAVSLAVHSPESIEPVFTTNTRLCGVALPREGDFVLDVMLQMNVPVNVYTIRARIWDVEKNRECFPGPAAQVRVVESAAFFGPVQMNPRLQLRT
jgi:ABC-type polysaccharide/polyol phosphate transport system ATPase subunit